jgi:hypothetical protein
MTESALPSRIAAAMLWIAAFSFATGLYFSIILLFAYLPPTSPVAVGIVTILQVSKLRDYVSAAVFFLLVPPLTIWLRGVGQRYVDREQRRFTPRRDTVVALLFTTPFLLSPILYLTTGKYGWVLLMPVALAFAGTRTLLFFESRLWVRQAFRRELYPYHALVFAEGLSWILFRYLVVGHRFAHISTLFLEAVFVALFTGLFWVVALFISRLTGILFGTPMHDVFRRIASAAVPLVLLPLVPLIVAPTPHAADADVMAFLLVALISLRLRKPLPPPTAWNLAAYFLLPLLVYWISYGTTAHQSDWVDLFHRGESIGPASDYLRGKAPYRDVFALHGMLEDGQLDAWLMEMFGRSLDVSVAQTAVLGGFLAVSLWYLGMVIFESIPLAVIVVLMGSWTTAENNRTSFQVAAVALFWNALRRRSSFSAVASGIFAAVALFFSYEIGVYTIIGAPAAAGVLWLASRRVEWTGLHPIRAAACFLAGVLAGAAPFLIYLMMRGALTDFFTVSFIDIPNVIDAVWSLPFPDLVSTFRAGLNLHTLADFVLWEKFHLILSPLTIAVSAIYYLQRLIRRRTDSFDHALMLLAVLATITQRTAFGRAEFRHQYFAAFLIGPMLVMLSILALRRLGAIWHEGDGGTRAFVAAVILGVIPILGVLFWIPDLINARIDDLDNYQRRVIHVLHDPHAEEVRNRIDAVRDEIDDLTRPNEPIFDFSNQPAFYFFVDRPNPTRFYQVPMFSPRAFQSEVLAALERTKPKVIIRTSPELYDQFDGIPNSLRAQAVAAYIDDCYRFYKSVRGVELWTRNRSARPRPLSSYLTRIRIPSEKEVVDSRPARMVFPLVGSREGANQSFWVSDVTIHNPFREAIPVSLRFVSGDTRIDRSLRLAARQTMVWPDIVRTLFGMSGGIGTLWIHYREGLAPVAVVKTSDVAHNARASIESPLTSRDAATADSGTAELTIVGIPARDSLRRVNLGVVNTGIIPATFRITARTRSGRAIGKTIESGVAEDEVWLIPDIEHELGSTIDESTTIRITVVAGTGVAFATVVDPGGDNSFVAAIPAQQQ